MGIIQNTLLFLEIIDKIKVRLENIKVAIKIIKFFLTFAFERGMLNVIKQRVTSR